MYYVDMLIVMIVAAVLTAVFGAGVRGHRGATLFAFFLLLFAPTWAIGIWVTPVGPQIMGGYWLTFLTVGIVVALLIVVVLHPRPEPAEKTTRTRTPEENAVFGVFF